MRPSRPSRPLRPSRRAAPTPSRSRIGVDTVRRSAEQRPALSPRAGRPAPPRRAPGPPLAQRTPTGGSPQTTNKFNWFGRRTERARKLPLAARTPARSTGARLGRDMRGGAQGALSRVLQGTQRGAASGRTGVPRNLPQQSARAASARSTEARTPVQRRRRTVLVALGIVQVLLLAAALWTLTSPVFEVRHVRIVGTDDAVLSADVRALPLTGCNIFRCDLAGRTRRVEALAGVASASIEAVYPDSLTVVVTPRHPAVIWRTATSTMVVADDGTLLGTPERAPYLTRMPLTAVMDDRAAIYAGHQPVVGMKLPPQLVKMAELLRDGVAATMPGDWTLRYDAERGFYASDGANRQVIFGTPTAAAQAQANTASGVAALGSLPTVAQVASGTQRQIAMLKALSATLTTKQQRFTIIDLRWGGHPYYRLDTTSH